MKLDTAIHKQKSRTHRLAKWTSIWKRWRDVLIRSWQSHLWALFGCLWLIAFYLGYIGLSKYTETIGVNTTPLDLIYNILQLIVLESGAIESPLPWELEIARFILPTLAALSAVKALALLFRDQAQLVALRFIRDHIVICGLSRKGFLLTRSFLAHHDKVVVIELDDDNDLLEQCRANGAIVLIGDAVDTTLLQRAAIHRAKCLISVCDDDGINAEVAVKAQDLLSTRTRTPLKCILHVVDPQLCGLLREKEIGREEFTSLRLEMFNTYSYGARLLLEEFPAFKLVDDGNSLSPHMLVVGLGNFGENVVIHAARAWYMNRPSQNQRLRITVVEEEADWKCESLTVRYPQLAQSCELTPWSMNVRSPKFIQAEFLFNTQNQIDVDIVYVCLNDDSIALNSSLSLLHHLREEPIPIIVRMTEDSGLASLLRGRLENESAFQNLSAFGLLDRTCTPDLLFSGDHEVLAHALHEEYIRQQEVSGKISPSASTSLSWNCLPEVEKESNRRQVDRIGAVLKVVGCGIAPLLDWGVAPFEFSQDEIERMARMEHQLWCKELHRKGWSYAPGVKNPKKRTHPDLVPWDELPESEKGKNRTPVRELPELMARIGYKIYRLK